jgi:hypothetical protein
LQYFQIVLLRGQESQHCGEKLTMETGEFLRLTTTPLKIQDLLPLASQKRIEFDSERAAQNPAEKVGV